MKRFWLYGAAMAVVSACNSGNPWVEDDGTGVTPAPTIPEELTGDLAGVTYDPVAQTLTVTGIALDSNPDNTATETVYTRKPGLDRNGYEAYTAQKDSLDRHTTAYVRDINGTQAAIVMTGGQFGHVFGGSTYSRSGTFSAPNFGPPVAGQENSGSVTYIGNYVGLLNGAGDGGDLKPVTPGTAVDIRPVQAAEITGRVAINADFGQGMRVNGEIYNRVIVDNPGIVLENLELSPTALAADGTFTGATTQDAGSSDVGTYGGVFGGTGATEVAGTLYAQDHIDALDNEEEYGLFVLSQCGTANDDALCNQPSP